MLPPKEGTETRTKCPVIGCESFLLTAYKTKVFYKQLILKCDNCGHEKDDDDSLLPLISKSYGKCPIETVDVDRLADELRCKICNDETTSFVFPEKIGKQESMHKYTCCETISCYFELVKRLENGKFNTK
ncbi:MAG: hypothetical protein ACKUBY_03305 [Candidatus Moraniibacteriota bacterium]|jgi:hypothetical protein